MADLPGIDGMPIPLISSVRAQRTAGHVTSFDAGAAARSNVPFAQSSMSRDANRDAGRPDDIEQIIQ